MKCFPRDPSVLGMYDLSAQSSIVTGLFQRRNESALYPWLHSAVTNLNLFPRLSHLFPISLFSKLIWKVKSI